MNKAQADAITRLFNLDLRAMYVCARGLVNEGEDKKWQRYALRNRSNDQHLRNL